MYVLTFFCCRWHDIYVEMLCNGPSFISCVSQINDYTAHQWNDKRLGKKGNSEEAYLCSCGNWNLHVHWSGFDSDNIQSVCCSWQEICVWSTRYNSLSVARPVTGTVFWFPRPHDPSAAQEQTGVQLNDETSLLTVFSFHLSSALSHPILWLEILVFCLSMWVSDYSCLRYDSSLRIIFHFVAF